MQSKSARHQPIDTTRLRSNSGPSQQTVIAIFTLSQNETPIIARIGEYEVHRNQSISANRGEECAIEDEHFA